MALAHGAGAASRQEIGWVVVPSVSEELRQSVVRAADHVQRRLGHAFPHYRFRYSVVRRNIADAFVSLGRRNQNLLMRQLDFITHLESNETDPDTLASLFRLDHLATRMRRNAESLLLLAGAEASRRWAAPVAVKDVVRAALSEVEGYERVVLSRVDPATVVGASAAELAHLLAELLDNALAYGSPAGEPVVVRGAAPDHCEDARADYRAGGEPTRRISPAHSVVDHLVKVGRPHVGVLEVPEPVLLVEELEAAGPRQPAAFDPPAGGGIFLVRADEALDHHVLRAAPHGQLGDRRIEEIDAVAQAERGALIEVLGFVALERGAAVAEVHHRDIVGRARHDPDGHACRAARQRDLAGELCRNCLA